MRLRNLTYVFLLLCLSTQNIAAQKINNETLKDTIAYSEENSLRVIEFAQLIETAIHDSDAETFVAKLNKDKFFNRILNDYPTLDPNDPFVKGFIVGMNRALIAFPNEIITDVENDAYYDFINYRYDEQAQTYYALFRLYSSDVGMNYHDYRIVNIDGELQFSDMYIYLVGEHFTDTIGRVMQYTMPKDSIVEEKNPEKKELLKAILLNKSGDYKKAYKILNGFKSELSNEKFLLIFKILVSMQLDEDKYLASLEDLIEAFPDDPTIALNRVDYHLYKENYIEAIQVINQLQNETEDDFLNFMKAGIAFEDKNYDLALNLYTYTIENYPDFFEGQVGYLSTLVLMKNYTDTSKYLDTLIEEGYDKEALIEYIEEDDEFGENILEGYAKSNEFTQWKNN
nr:hypothetical protein [uncultured Psychroserpens sp.]